MNEIDLVDWSRMQFALTAMYHWLFVPLTLGLSFIVAFMETIYVKTGQEVWLRITKFWMTLFAINFAIGVATGIIMEFEFGTNWSNYAWFVGDIFGAPLAVEGLVAFFMESTFFAVMFFGWNKVSKKMHLLSTWLVAIGSNLSALWILVANGWMQYPVGMEFNIDMARNEMVDFFAVLLSPVAISKFLHTIGSGYVTGALFVCGISAWYLIKKRDIEFARRSMVVGASFGLLAILFVVMSGDRSAYFVAQKQPAKLAAMEALYDGEKGAPEVLFALLNPNKQIGDKKEHPFIADIYIPYLLSILAHHDLNAFVPGIDDLVFGNKKHGVMGAQEKIDRGRIALKAYQDYRMAKAANDLNAMMASKKTFDQHLKYLGYGYLENPEDIIPNVPLLFYSFHIMVGLGTYFVALFFIVLFLSMTGRLEDKVKLLWLLVLSIPLAYVTSECGWIVAEAGRQPWVVQDLLPTSVARSNIDVESVKITFFLFAFLFTTLLIAEVRIMLKQISLGFKRGH